MPQTDKSLTQKDTQLPDRMFNHEGKVEDFRFDEQVTRVFDDMVHRSVPGYADMLKGIGEFAPLFVQPNSKVYDLGCSLGSASRAILSKVDHPAVSLVAVDLSQHMLGQAELRLCAEGFRSNISFLREDVCTTDISQASFVVLNLTLQFLEPGNARQNLIDRIYQALRPKGALVVSEKVRFSNPEIQDMLDKQQMDFKRQQGYSDLEIAQKRNALENVMKLDTIEDHLTRFQRAGFVSASTWYQNLNFASFIALKS